MCTRVNFIARKLSHCARYMTNANFKKMCIYRHSALIMTDTVHVFTFMTIFCITKLTLSSLTFIRCQLTPSVRELHFVVLHVANCWLWWLATLVLEQGDICSCWIWVSSLFTSQLTSSWQPCAALTTGYLLQAVSLLIMQAVCALQQLL